MKNMWNRFISMLLVLTMLISSVPGVSFAGDSDPVRPVFGEPSYEFIIDGETYTINVNDEPKIL